MSTRTWAAGLVATTLLLTACSSSPEEVTDVEAALVPVEEQVSELPGIVSADLRVQSVTGIEDADSIEVLLVSDATTAPELVEDGRAAVELLWRSSVPDIASVLLSVQPEDRELSDADGRRLEVVETIPADELAETFGARPSED